MKHKVDLPAIMPGIIGVVERVRRQQPLIHYVPNLVTAGFVADALLAFGAAPIMAVEPEEFAELPAAAVALNIGTLSSAYVPVLEAAGRTALVRGRPLVLDPVGAGATTLRREIALYLLGCCPGAVVRANAGEAGALLDRPLGAHGVDVRGGSAPTAELATQLARRIGAVAAVTGVVDAISDGGRTLAIANGHPWLAAITGAGCMLTGMVAACLAVEPDPLLAAAAATLAMGVAGQLAATRSSGPGTFRAALLDALAGLDAASIQAMGRTQWI
jgi:hydroxyethylthiazole kinase